MTAPLTVAALEQAARDMAGLGDFGPDTGWREGFVRLVAAVEAMGPNEQLRHMAAHNIVGQLATRLRFVEDDRLHPEIAAQDADLGRQLDQLVKLFDYDTLQTALTIPEDEL